MPRSPSNNTLVPLLHKLSQRLGVQQAKSELRWLVEHARATLSDTTNSPQHHQPHKQARLWRDQPAPSEEEVEQDRLRFTSVQWAWLRQAVADRTERHKPLQYILGDQPFGKTSLSVRPPVLIPRWETEEWMLKLAEMIRQHMAAQAEEARGGEVGQRSPLKILDACTGTGCISLGLASELPPESAQITGVDISAEAISLASDNLAFNQLLLNNRVEFRQLDLQSPDILPKLLGVEPTWDMIVSNPPYVTPAEYHSLDLDVKEWEDKRALVPLPPNADPQAVKDEELDPSGIAFIVHLTKLAKEMGLADVSRSEQAGSTLPRLVVEIGGSQQVEPVRQAMHDHGFNSTEVWRDMAGTDRVVLGYFKL
ncbi:S-adenosyl-L-methionine-dependent methyltransferase [Martensiomyces pterosporus]|nr:S-adenosyl-L-methionine-dependent methyltransferase [Martensiomyces pterosporus]